MKKILILTILLIMIQPVLAVTSCDRYGNKTGSYR